MKPYERSAPEERTTQGTVKFAAGFLAALCCLVLLVGSAPALRAQTGGEAGI